MSTSRNVRRDADDKHLTLGELHKFIGDLDEAGAAESTVISGRVNWGGTLRSVWATAVRFGDTAPSSRKRVRD